MNPVLQLYYQIEPEEAQSTKMKAMLDLFHEIIEEPLFNQLRLVITCFSSLLIDQSSCSHIINAILVIGQRSSLVMLSAALA